VTPPALRRPGAAGVTLALASFSRVDLDFVTVDVVTDEGHGWPGMPLISVVDDRSALVAARRGADVTGHWSTAPTFVAAARLTLERLRQPR
jgi:hypothetical protein